MPVKRGKLLEGKVLAAKIQEEIKASIEQFRSQGLEPPRLLRIQVTDDPSSRWYLGEQEKLAKKLGIELEPDITPDKVSNQNELLRQIEYASSESKSHGVFITMPLPQGFDVDLALHCLKPEKDVEGIHPTNLGLIVLRRGKIIPPTAYAVLHMIESTGIMLRGKQAAIIGQSAIVGRPVQLLLGERRVTTTVCNTGTPLAEIEKAVMESNIVVACAGQPGLVKGAWIKPGAIVIDVGTTEVDGKLVGDIEFEEARKRAGFISPVPGGVGPLTVTMLMKNLIHAYKWQKEL